MTPAEVTQQDLFKACESLFGTDIDVSVEFLRYLKPAGVRAAYRKKAMETHPDRAAVLDGQADFMADRFKEISLAYRLLSEFLAAPEKYSLDEQGALYRRRRTRPAARADAAAPPAEPLYTGRIPARRLLFGQYLYYAGRISLSALVKAVVWQRLQRPSVGALAQSWAGWPAATSSIFCASGATEKNSASARCVWAGFPAASSPSFWKSKNASSRKSGCISWNGRF